jgi:hypothetical protein
MSSLSLEIGTEVSIQAVRELASQMIPEELAADQFTDLGS